MKMTEVLGEFDAPSPAPKSYCSRISSVEYERQSSINTEASLKELLDYLEYNPTAFYNIVMKRKGDDIESNNGIFGYIKSKMISWLYGQEMLGEMNAEEAREKLREFKCNVIKSYNYGQEAKGSVRRFSRRVANKKWQQVSAEQKDHYIKKKQSHVNRFKSNQHSVFNVNTSVEYSQHNTIFPVPPSHVSSSNAILAPPPPPPPPPPPALPPLISNSITFGSKNDTKSCVFKGEKENVGLTIEQIHTQRKLLKPATSKDNTMVTTLPSDCNFTNMMKSIKNPKCRKILKSVSQNSDASITPAQAHKKRKVAERENEPFNMFNQELIQKFKRAQGSPLVESPSSGREFTP